VLWFDSHALLLKEIGAALHTASYVGIRPEADILSAMMAAPITVATDA